MTRTSPPSSTTDSRWSSPAPRPYRTLPSGVPQKTSWPPSHAEKSKPTRVSTSTVVAGKPAIVEGRGRLAIGAIDALEFGGPPGS